ncbi:hypothetical protein ACJX0J_021457, partial [Zea mays]
GMEAHKNTNIANANSTRYIKEFFSLEDVWQLWKGANERPWAYLGTKMKGKGGFCGLYFGACKTLDLQHLNANYSYLLITALFLGTTSTVFSCV